MNKIKRYIRFNFMNCQKLKFSMAFFASGKKKGTTVHLYKSESSMER